MRSHPQLSQLILIKRTVRDFLPVSSTEMPSGSGADERWADSPRPLCCLGVDANSSLPATASPVGDVGQSRRADRGLSAADASPRMMACVVLLSSSSCLELTICYLPGFSTGSEGSEGVGVVRLSCSRTLASSSSRSSGFSRSVSLAASRPCPSRSSP